jgi:hypothetical protein
MKKQRKKIKIFKPTNVLTVFLMLAILSVIVGYLFMFLNDNYGFDNNEPLKIEDYEIEISVINAEETNLQQFSMGTEFNLTGKNTYFGFVSSHATYEEYSHYGLNDFTNTKWQNNGYRVYTVGTSGGDITHRKELGEGRVVPLGQGDSYGDISIKATNDECGSVKVERPRIELILELILCHLCSIIIMELESLTHM